MQKGIKRVLAAVSAVICASTAQADTNPDTFVGPSLQGTYTGWISPIGALSLLSELGPKNSRLGATLAWQFQEVERIKISAEYLWERINYPFLFHNSSQRLGQAAAGFDYQYQIDRRFNPIFDFSAYASHDTSATLQYYTGVTSAFDGAPVPYTDTRRVAAVSLASGASAGFFADIWCGGKLGLSLNYDNVRYDNRLGPTSDATGFGGTAQFTQVITDNVSVAVAAAIRAPFNNYQASLNWATDYHGRWTVGVYGNYTNGKDGLVNSSNAGISLNYYADRMYVQPPLNLKDEGGPAIITDVDVEFLNWVSDPAIYMPQVLAIPEEVLTVTA